MRFILAAVLALMAVPAIAAPVPAWTVDKAASHIGFQGAMNGQGFTGGFSRWDAKIEFDPGNLAGSKVTAVIDTGSAKTGDQTRDEALPTEDWFSIKVFPGDLTIRNATHPVTLPFTLAIAGDTAKMSGSLPLDRSLFGVGQGQFKTGDTVALKVQVNLAITANRAH